MSDLAKYIGLPWACPDDPPRSYDCWSLVCQVRTDFGLYTPLIMAPHTLGAFNAEMAREIATGRWDVAAARPGNVTILGPKQNHCGVVVDHERNVMHSYSPDGKTGAVRCDSWRMIEKLFGQVEVYAYRA